MSVSLRQWTTARIVIDNFLFQIAEDDRILPGVEGKIVVWVEEE